MEGIRSRHGLGLLLSISLFLMFLPENLLAMQEASAPPTSSREHQYATKTPEQVQQLVAPIALYQDSLVAQILSAATFPEQVVEANRWIQAHPNLKDDGLAKAVDQQTWDPSVKALTAFPSVLGNMDKNLSWTSTLGDTYYNQPEDVMAAVQIMRQKAEQSGNLKTTQQQVVKTEGSTIIVESANPEVVYVPAYDPWAVYGGVIVAWPEWYHYSGVWYSGTYVYFGAAVYVGYYSYYGWGWHHWGCDWHHRWAEHDHSRYYSRSRTSYNRNHYYRSSSRSGRETSSRGGNRSSNRSSGERGNAYSHSQTSQRASEGNSRAARGYGDARGQSNTRTGGSSNYSHGGGGQRYSARGSSSMGGGGVHGGGFHGGGGFHR